MRTKIKQMIPGLFLAALLAGCDKAEPVAPAGREKVEVEMNGRLARTVQSKGPISPRLGSGGLPEEQLAVAVITVNFTTSDPETLQPGLAAWRGSTADITRGYFGGPGIGATEITNGEIKYTNEDGDLVQRVFYDENGEYYFIRVLYPYLTSEFTQTDRGAGMVFYDVDGHQDILCTNLGWGNIDQPVIQTSYKIDPESPEPAEGDGVFVFSHLLSQFRINVVAESAVAVHQYGKIKNIRIIEQPGVIKVDMIDLATTSYDDSDTDYYLEDFQLDSLPSYNTALPNNGYTTAGSLMLLPARKFTIEAETDRLWLTAHFDFATEDDANAITSPGTIYDINLKFMEGYEMDVKVDSITNQWWMDHEFN